MFVLDKQFVQILRGLALLSVIILGLASILATQGSSGDDPAPSFANAGPDQSVVTLERTQLDGTGSHTPLYPGDEHPTYLWTVLSSPPKPDPLFPYEETYQLQDASRIRSTLIPLIEGEYVLQLLVRSRNLSAWDTVSIFAYENVAPPNARAGPDQFVKHGALVNLNASASHAQVEDHPFYEVAPFDYRWFMNQHPAGFDGALSSTDALTTRFIAEYDADDFSRSTEFVGHSLYETRLHVIDNDERVSRPVHVRTYVFPAEGFVHPIPRAGQEQWVSTGSTVQLDGSASYDVDARELSYDWRFYSLPFGSQASLTGADTPTPSFVADLDGVYVVQLQVDNGELSSFRLHTTALDYELLGEIDYAGSDRVVITAVSESNPSIADAGADRIIPYTGSTAIPLDGSGSYRPDGEPTSYQWYLVSVPDGSGASIDSAHTSEADGASLLADLPGDYLVGLSLDELYIDFDNAHTLISITENSPPDSDAGADQQVNTGDTVMLDAGGSVDPDGDPLGYSWSLASAPGPWGWEDLDGDDLVEWVDWPSLSEGMSATPSFTPDRNGEYRLLLTVNDGEHNSGMDEVVITATGSAINTPPVADAGDDQTVTVGAAVTLDGSGSSDADNDPLSYAWSLLQKPNGSTATLDDMTSVTPGFVADLAGDYALQLTVSDGLATSLPDGVTVTAQEAGACADPLTLTTTLPFAPGEGEVATNIRIDADGPDTLSAVTATGFPLDSDVYQARIPDGNQPDEAEFVIILPPTWEEISRTHPNPISDTQSPAFIVRRIADGIVFQLQVEFTATAMLEVQIDALSGCRCGMSAADCPP